MVGTPRMVLVTGLVLALATGLLAPCPCAPSSACRSAAEMAADHACCATEGVRAADHACCADQPDETLSATSPAGPPTVTPSFTTQHLAVSLLAAAPRAVLPLRAPTASPPLRI